MSALEKQRSGDTSAVPEPSPVAAQVPPVSSAEEAHLAASHSTAMPSEHSAEAGAAESPELARTAKQTPLQRPAIPERRVLKPHSDVRGRIAALGDVADMIPDRRAPAASAAASSMPASGRTEAVVPEVASGSRRRAFGKSAGDAEAGSRRRKSASKDVITWQRLGVLAIFMAAVGGGASLLQSVVGRDEATVSADAIGNAAIASVAPSQGLPMAMPQSEPAPAQAASSEPARPATTPTAAPPALRSAVATTAPNNLLAASLSTSGLASSGASASGASFAALPASVSAFAAPEVASASPISAPRPDPLPKQAPLPPPKQLAVAATSTPASATEQPDDTADDASATAAPFGGAPTDTVTIRSSVTMRAAPKKGARPIGNIPSGRKVDLVACTSWCEVISEGKRGFIYKSFIGASAPKEASAAEDDAAPETVTQ